MGFVSKRFSPPVDDRENGNRISRALLLLFRFRRGVVAFLTRTLVWRVIFFRRRTAAVAHHGAADKIDQQRTVDLGLQT